MSVLAHDAKGTDGTTASSHRPSLVADSARDPTTACSCDVDTETEPAGPILVLRVAGEIDMLTQPLVRTAMDAALGQTPQTWWSTSPGWGSAVRGFELLTRTAHRGRAHRPRRGGFGFSLSGLSPHLDRITTMLWPEQHFLRYRSAAAAVTALRIEHTYRTS